MNTFLDPATIPGALVYAAIVIAASWAIGSVFQTLIHRYLDRAEAAGTDTTSVRFIAQLARIFVYIIAFAIYAYIVPSLHSFDAAWLTSIGVISVVIGMAAQNTLGNLIAGISVILYRPFRIGDRIQVNTPAGPAIGVVEQIGLGYTRLRAPDGRRVVLPNSIMATQTNINFSRRFSNVLIEIELTVADARQVERVQETLLDAAREVSKITKVNGCFMLNLWEKGTTVMLSVMCLDPGDIAGIRSEILTQVKQVADAEHILFN